MAKPASPEKERSPPCRDDIQTHISKKTSINHKNLYPRYLASTQSSSLRKTSIKHEDLNARSLASSQSSSSRKTDSKHKDFNARSLASTQSSSSRKTDSKHKDFNARSLASTQSSSSRKTSSKHNDFNTRSLASTQSSSSRKTGIKPHYLTSTQSSSSRKTHVEHADFCTRCQCRKTHVEHDDFCTRCHAFTQRSSSQRIERGYKSNDVSRNKQKIAVSSNNKNSDDFSLRPPPPPPLSDFLAFGRIERGYQRKDVLRNKQKIDVSSNNKNSDDFSLWLDAPPLPNLVALRKRKLKNLKSFVHSTTEQEIDDSHGRRSSSDFEGHLEGLNKGSSYEFKRQMNDRLIKQKLEDLNRKKDLLYLILSYPMDKVDKGRHQGWIRDVLHVNRKVRENEKMMTAASASELYSEILRLLDHSMDDIEAYIPHEMIKKKSLKQVAKASAQLGDIIPVPEKIRKLAVDFAINQILKDIENPEIQRIRICGRDATRVTSQLNNLPQIMKMFKVVVQLRPPYSTEAIAAQLGDSTFGRHEVDRFLKGTNFLIILNETCDSTDLSKVGITNWWNSEKIQKIVSTNELQKAHDWMAVDLEIRMIDHLLSWELFCIHVGEVVHSSHIQDMAVDVVERCRGHLLVIVLMGRALKEVDDVRRWEQASHALCLSPTTTSQSKDSVLFNALAFLCEQHLSSRANHVKHCALNMDKKDMDKVHLIQMWIEEGLIGTADEGELIVEDLLKAFLLESSQDGVSLRMRDEIFEELGNLFRAKPNLSVLNLAGKGLQTVLPNDEAIWEKADEIHLMNNELSELPDSPNCPQLTTLLLQANPFLTVIPPSFFEHMTSLQILDLSHTRIRSLPDSLFKLSKLRNFLLRGCERFMEMPPEVGELSNLEMLDFGGTEIVSLPLEVGKLSKLKCLKLSFYGEDEDERKNYSCSTTIIPENVIGKLLLLEELSVEVNPEDERWNVIAKDITKEVCNLNRLRALDLYLPESVLLNDFMSNIDTVFLSSWRFRLTVGRHLKRIISRLPHEPMLKFQQQQRCLKFINGEDIPVEIKVVLPHATALFLDRHLTLTKLSEFGFENLKKLKVCVLAECKEMQTIVDEADGGDVNEEIILGSLQYLSIHYMKNLKSIWKGPVHKGCLSSLMSLTLQTCPELTTIFTLDLLENLNLLEELLIENCPQIDSIVTHDLPAKEVQLCSSVKHLPKLKKISLHYMQKLVTISSGLCIAPKVEWMSFYGCPNLKTLSPLDVSSSNLKGIIGELDWWNDLTPNVQPENPNFTFFAINGATELMKKLEEIGDQRQH